MFQAKNSLIVLLCMLTVGCGSQTPTLQPPLVLPTATADFSTVDGAMFDVTVEPIATQQRATIEALPTVTPTIPPIDNSDVTPISSSETGIRGEILIGPTCPASSPDFNEEACDDQPFPGVISIFDAEGNLLTVVQSNIRGRFAEPLDPGTYVIYPEPGPTMETSGPQTIEVIEGEYTPVRIQYDSGIR